MVESGRMLSERAGLHVAGFAPPFGRMTRQVRDVVRRHYRWCVGTTLNVADDEDDVFDLPRVEMWYFRNPHRLQRLVTRGRSPYFQWRRALRLMSQKVSS